MYIFFNILLSLPLNFYKRTLNRYFQTVFHHCPPHYFYIQISFVKNIFLCSKIIKNFIYFWNLLKKSIFFCTFLVKQTTQRKLKNVGMGVWWAKVFRIKRGIHVAAKFVSRATFSFKLSFKLSFPSSTVLKFLNFQRKLFKIRNPIKRTIYKPFIEMLSVDDLQYTYALSLKKYIFKNVDFFLLKNVWTKKEKYTKILFINSFMFLWSNQ